MSSKFGDVSAQVPAPIAIPTDGEVKNFIDAQSQQRPAEVPNLIQAGMIFTGRIKPSVTHHEQLSEKATAELEGEVKRREAELTAIADREPELDKELTRLDESLTALNSQFVTKTSEAGLMTDGNHPEDVKKAIAGAIGIRLPEKPEEAEEMPPTEKAKPNRLMSVLSYFLEGLLFSAPGAVFSVTLGLIIGFLAYADVQDGLLLTPKIVLMFAVGVVLIYTMGLIINNLTERSIKVKEATPDQPVKAVFPLYIGWAVVILFWIAEIAVEANGLHLLYLQRATSLARNGQNAEVLPMVMFYLFGIIISTPYFFMKMARAAKKASAEQDAEWQKYRHERRADEVSKAELEATVKLTDFLRNCPPAAEALRLANEIEGLDKQLEEVNEEIDSLLAKKKELEQPILLSDGIRQALEQAERGAHQAMADFNALVGADLFQSTQDKNNNPVA